MLKHGYAHADDVTWFFYGLLRAAKLDASLVLVSTRDDNFFDPRLMNARDLNTCVVLVNLGDSSVYLDPGTPFMPFAYLPWSETAVKGLRLGTDGGQWVTTTVPGATESRVERKVVHEALTVRNARGQGHRDLHWPRGELASHHRAQ